MDSLVKSNVRQALLEAFSESGRKLYIRGKIGKEIGCSRTAIWKHIEELKRRFPC